MVEYTTPECQHMSVENLISLNLTHTIRKNWILDPPGKLKNIPLLQIRLVDQECPRVDPSKNTRTFFSFKQYCCDICLLYYIHK